MMQLSAIYYSSRVTPQGKRYPTFVLSTGIRKDFFKKKLSVIVTASDILRTLWQKAELNTAYLRQTSIGRRDAQVMYLGFSYRFGKSAKQPKEEKLQFDNAN